MTKKLISIVFVLILALVPAASAGPISDIAEWLGTGINIGPQPAASTYYIEDTYVQSVTYEPQLYPDSIFYVDVVFQNTLQESTYWIFIEDSTGTTVAQTNPFTLQSGELIVKSLELTAPSSTGNYDYTLFRDIPVIAEDGSASPGPFPIAVTTISIEVNPDGTVQPTRTPTATATPTGTNTPPVVTIGVVDMQGMANYVRFDAYNSYDPDGTITAYQWHIDGVLEGTSESMLYNYSPGDTIEVKLTVWDNAGAAIAAIRTVSFEIDEITGETIVEPSEETPATVDERKPIFTVNIAGKPFHIPGFGLIGAIGAIALVVLAASKRKE